MASIVIVDDDAVIRRGPTRWSWAILALAVPCSFLGLALRALGGDFRAVHVVETFTFFMLQAVGALVAARRPDNPIGWILLVFGFLLAVSLASSAYFETAGFSKPMPAGALLLMWLTSKWYAVFFGLISALFFLFPTGSLPTRGWRHVARVSTVGFVLFPASLYVKRGPLDDESPLSAINPMNPVGLEGTAGQIRDLLEAIGGSLVLFGLAASAACLIYRFWRSSGEERLQLKWFATAAGFSVVVLLTGIALRNNTPGIPVELVDVVLGLAFSTLPISAGVAILKYRLYDIDVIINRTLVYGALTGFLAAAYLTSVFVLQQLSRPLTGESGLAVVISTLTVTALFRPARSRIQAFIDRRFYRSKYDAEKTLEAFSARLREEVDLNALKLDLVAVVTQTMQPTHVSLWLRRVNRRG